MNTQQELKRWLKMVKTILLNTTDIISICKAERQKAIYEKSGFNLIKTEQTGFNKFRLTYKEVCLK